MGFSTDRRIRIWRMAHEDVQNRNLADRGLWAFYLAWPSAEDEYMTTDLSTYSQAPTNYTGEIGSCQGAILIISAWPATPTPAVLKDKRPYYRKFEKKNRSRG
jgi:hypothetical protein